MTAPLTAIHEGPIPAAPPQPSYLRRNLLATAALALLFAWAMLSHSSRPEPEERALSSRDRNLETAADRSQEHHWSFDRQEHSLRTHAAATGKVAAEERRLH